MSKISFALIDDLKMNKSGFHYFTKTSVNGDEILISYSGVMQFFCPQETYSNIMSQTFLTQIFVINILYDIALAVHS